MLNGSQLIPGSSAPEDSPSLPTMHSPGEPHADSPQTPEIQPAPFICISSALRRLFLQARVIASRTPFATLEGEAGTGKYLFAQTIHHTSPLGGLPFRRFDARAWLSNDSEGSPLSGTLYLDRVDMLASTGQGLLLNFIKRLQN